MNILRGHMRIIVWTAGIIAVIAAFVLFWLGGSKSPSLLGGTAGTAATGTSAGNMTTTVTNAAVSVPAALTKSGSKGTASVPAAPTAITINLITPISGNAWTIGQTNPIAWSVPANITGEIDLVNAKTKAFIGVILSETGPKQTSFAWDARSIYLARYSADKKDVVPGTYSIRIHFDGNGFSDLVSGPVTISN